MLEYVKKTLEENIEATKIVVDYAKKYNISVEAELGLMGNLKNNQVAVLI